MGCTGLTGDIPADLFKNCLSITNCEATFYNCSKLTGNAIELWNRTNITSNDECYYNCTGLTNYADIPSGWK